MQIDIDFDVFKALTARRRHEAHSYNEVLRDLLELPRNPGRSLADGIAAGLRSSGSSFLLRDGELPDGTQLRATYKGREYKASIRRGQWLDGEDASHASPSAAAKAITGSNVNGLRFWHAKRPGDGDWRRLDILMAVSS